MSLLSWVGKVIGLKDGRFFGQWYGGENWAGKPVNEVNSMHLSAWWRCVRLYADVVGSIPIKFYERIDSDERVPARDHQIANLLSIDPNADQTPPEFWGCIAGGLAMFGNGYAEKRYVGATLAALEPLPYDTVPDRTRLGNANGDLEFRFYDRGQQEWLPRDKVFQVRGFTLGRADSGLSPLAAARQGLSIALATEESAGKTFSQGLRASGFFAGPRLDKDQRETFKKTFIDPITGNDASAHYGILENGFDFKPINITPQDAEMLLSRRYNVEEICRFMGVPPILAGHSPDGQTAWGTGIEAIINQWLTSGLNSFLRYIEAAINKRVLSPVDRQTYFAEFDRNALLRADSAARAALYWQLVQIASMTPNQVCDRENLPRFEGGDVRLANSTLRPLSVLGALPVQQPTGQEAKP